jgi:hypothetical protein
LTLTQVVIPVVWAGFIMWTIRKLWRSSKDPALAKYDTGTKFIGVATTVGCAATFPSILGYPGVPYWLEALIDAIIAFPVSLWVGFAICRCFQAMDR